MRAVISVINNHANYSTSPTFTKRLEGLSTAMSYQLATIKMKSNRSLAFGSVDAGDITVAYRSLSYLFDAFLMDITLESATNTHEVRTTMQKILLNMLLTNLPQANCAAYDAKSHAGRRICTAKTGSLVFLLSFRHRLERCRPHFSYIGL
ncbi:hypothetical protein L208DRAFT_510379 [Tricholoma matsutake]|nr:hypothetical protein L208DRAFT_510379 [Tricholoma matsutake 945]